MLPGRADQVPEIAALQRIAAREHEVRQGRAECGKRVEQLERLASVQLVGIGVRRGLGAAVTAREVARAGQLPAALVESSLTLLLFTTVVFSLFDFGYVWYLHQTVVDRARAAARYGSLNPTDTTGMKNMVLYYSSTGSGAGLFGLRTSNVSASRSGAGTSADRVTVTVSGLSYFMIWPGRSGTGKPISVSVPVEAN